MAAGLWLANSAPARAPSSRSCSRWRPTWWWWPPPTSIWRRSAERALHGGPTCWWRSPPAWAPQNPVSDERRRPTGRRVKVGFNHRFHPGLARAAAEVHPGAHGALMHVRGRYGHGGRPGYNLEWRAQPRRSGGGELIDQGMHLLDLTHWIAGPLPLHSALLRTHFWEGEVEDNAALLLGGEDRTSPWAMLHVTWTEWKNMFGLEIYCRTAKLQVDGLVRSYGPQRLRIYRMRPELGPPDLEEITYPDHDGSWQREWENFAAAIDGTEPINGGLEDALYAWTQVEDAYARGPYAAMRDGALSARSGDG